METYIETVISYSQLTIVNDSFYKIQDGDTSTWDDDHVAQGFFWQDGYVAFGVEDHNGETLIRIADSQLPYFNREAERIIEVPFTIDGSTTRIGTVLDDHAFELSTGSYQIKFSLFRDILWNKKEFAYFADFYFLSKENPKFRIIRKGGEMTSDQVLKTN